MDDLLIALSDGSRRTILRTLRNAPATVTQLAELLPIARPGVSRHLRVLREVGLVDVEQDAQRRIYSLRTDPLEELDAWLTPYRDLWTGRMDALHTEIARGKRERRLASDREPATPTPDETPTIEPPRRTAPIRQRDAS